MNDRHRRVDWRRYQLALIRRITWVRVPPLQFREFSLHFIFTSFLKEFSVVLKVNTLLLIRFDSLSETLLILSTHGFLEK